MEGSGHADGIDDRPAATLERVDQEVAKTLSELELKLQELERELTSLGQRDAPRHRDNPPHEQASAPGRLIDEAVEREQRSEEIGDPQERTAEEAVADGDGFGGPAVWGGEEVPAQAGATIERNWTAEVRETAYGEIPIPPPQAPDAGAPETSQPPWPPAPASQHIAPPPHGLAPQQAHPSPQMSVSPQAHFSSHEPAPPHTSPVPHHPYAATPTERQSIDVADLVEFREKMRRTLDGLIAEYSRLLSPKPPA
jgi:hypothetical protein